MSISNGIAYVPGEDDSGRTAGDFELLGHVARRQRVVARDHYNLMRRAAEFPHHGLAVGLEGAGDDDKAGEKDLVLHLFSVHFLKVL